MANTADRRANHNGVLFCSSSDGSRITSKILLRSLSHFNPSRIFVTCCGSGLLVLYCSTNAAILSCSFFTSGSAAAWGCADSFAFSTICCAWASITGSLITGSNASAISSSLRKFSISACCFARLSLAKARADSADFSRRLFRTNSDQVSQNLLMGKFSS